MLKICKVVLVAILMGSISLISVPLNAEAVSKEVDVLSSCENAYLWKFGTTADSKLDVKVDKKNFVIGKSSIRIEYDVAAGKTGAWMYCNIAIPVNKNDWTGYESISFYLKGDGGDNTVKIGIKDAEEEILLSQESFDMKNTKWVHYTIPLTTEEGGFFSNPYYQPNKDSLQNPNVLDLTGVLEFQISVDDMWNTGRSGYLNIDQIELLM